MSTFDITKVFQYTLPTSSIEYIRNANGPATSVPLTLKNNDEKITLSLIINSDTTGVPATLVYNSASKLISNNSQVIQIPPVSSVSLTVYANQSASLNGLQNTVQQNILLDVVSGSVTSSAQIININTASNDRFAVDADIAPRELRFYADRLTYRLGSYSDFLGTYLTSTSGSYQFEPVYKVLTSTRVIYSRGQLQEKQRKLRIILDNFSQAVSGYIPQAVGGTLANFMVSNVWSFNKQDFPNMVPLVYSDPKTPASKIWNGESFSGGTVRLLKQALANALFCEGGVCADNYPNNYREHFDFSDNYIPSSVTVDGKQLTPFERLYWYCQDITKYYIKLIDSILNTQDSAYVSLDADNKEAARIQIPFEVKFTTYTVPLLDALLSGSTKIINDKAITFFDEAREYKTIANFNLDRQYVVEAWRLSPTDSNKLQLKLLTPLDDNIVSLDTAYITRDIAKSVVDTFELELGQEADVTPYLRPVNNSIKFDVAADKYISNVTIESLGLHTGSVGTLIDNNTYSYNDTVFRRWFTADFNSSELNIDFSDYKNIVNFGSAYDRLISFKNKLTQIETITNTNISASISSSVIGASNRALEIENIIRNFDPYEQFLYYAPTSSIYSASVDYVDGELEYNSPGTWPKNSDGTVYTIAQASSWFTAQSLIAQRYDEYNQNRLLKHLPLHIQESAESQEFLTFVSMIGHVMDNIKVYIDQFPYIHSTSPDPFSELTMDQVYEVAQSFGLQLPNIYSLTNLQDFISTYDGNSGSRSLVAETWKRVLHSAMYLMKSKGSRTSMDAVLNVYGMSSPMLQIKESTYPVAGNYIRSDELVYGLTFNSASSNYVSVPFVSASITAQTLQVRFNPTLRKGGSLLTGDSKWTIDIIPHPSASKLEYGKIQVTSGSGRAIIASSSYFPLFSADYTDIMLRSQSSDLHIIQTDGDQILYQESASVNLDTVWNNTTYVYIGSNGTNELDKFNGVVDEVRLWGENTTVQNFTEQAYDPGSLYGNNYTSSYDNLYVQLSFSQPLTSVTESVVNETPYKNVSLIPTVAANGFTTASYTRFERSIKQFTPIVGGTIFSNRKVVVAPPPVFSNQYVDGNGTKYLKPNGSIKSTTEKAYTTGLNQVSVAVSPTDYINQNIIRSMGVIDVNNVIGTPRNIKNYSYAYLDTLRNEFLKYFNKPVDPNEYSRFFRNLTQAPSEMAETMVPARAKLIDGIVIESDILTRNKSTLARSFRVSGNDTELNNAYVSGSGSFNVGAFTFDARYDMDAERELLGDTAQWEGEIDVPDEVKPISSTPSDKLPTPRKVYQYINNVTSDSLVTSSIMDNRSAFLTLEADAIETRPEERLSSPYPRNPYLGIPSKLPSEENTITPLYEISPRSDFSDVGTTTYFHKETGVYSYILTTPYKTPYVVKLDTKSDSPLDRLYANITLLEAGIVTTVTGRDTGDIPTATYTAGSNTAGVIKMANTFTLLGINGANGLRLRLYRDAGARDADISRPFTTIPSGSQGVLFDGLLNGQQDIFPHLMMQTPDSNIYYTITNTTASDIVSTISIDYFIYEAGNPAPTGYLPRHYRFSRDNTTALKRRNYVGTAGTDLVAPPGCPWVPCPPFGTENSEANTVTVTTTGVAVVPNGGTASPNGGINVV